MIDFTWIPGVAPHLLVAANPWTREDIFALSDRTGARRAGFHADGWVRYEDGEKVTRWWLKFCERKTLFNLNRSICVDPARCSAERLLRMLRRTQEHAGWTRDRLHALLTPAGGRTLFHCKDEYAWVYEPHDGGWGMSLGKAADAPADNDALLAARVHALWCRSDDWDNRSWMIGQALLRVVASQLPPAKDHPEARVVKIGDEVFHARVDKTTEANSPDVITAWRLEKMAVEARVQ